MSEYHSDFKEVLYSSNIICSTVSDSTNAVINLLQPISLFLLRKRGGEHTALLWDSYFIIQLADLKSQTVNNGLPPMSRCLFCSLPK